MAQQPLVRRGLLVMEASPSDTPHSVGLLWASDQPDAETLTTHNTRKRQTSMPLAGSEPTTQASERPQTHALYRHDR